MPQLSSEIKGGVPEEYIAHTLVCQKEPLGLKQHQTVKKIIPVASPVIELCLTEGISQSGSQSKENSVK